MKLCKKCGIEKDLSCFAKDRNSLRHSCKECNNASNRAYYKGKNILLKKAKGRAKAKNIPFDITVEDIIIPEVCPVLGIPLKAGEKIACETSPTIDRIRPELGYVKGNIQVVSYRANMLKSNATIEELQKVLEHLRNIV